MPFSSVVGSPFISTETTLFFCPAAGDPQRDLASPTHTVRVNLTTVLSSIFLEHVRAMEPFWQSDDQILTSYTATTIFLLTFNNITLLVQIYFYYKCIF